MGQWDSLPVGQELVGVNGAVGQWQIVWQELMRQWDSGTGGDGLSGVNGTLGQ